jgi:acetyltransferase-like isoleucine patch superfamily enzyme
VGDYNIINLDCTVGHEVQVGNFVTINPGVNVSGNVIIDDCVSIGTGSQLLQGKRIGSNSIIGAGAVVTTDIPEKCTAVGVPAKIIKDWR